MFRLRRYRVFLVFAVFVIGALYHFTSFQELEGAGAAGLKELKNYKTPSTPTPPPTAAEILDAHDDGMQAALASSRVAPAIIPSLASVQFIEQESIESTPTSAVTQTNSLKPTDVNDVSSKEVKVDTPNTAPESPTPEVEPDEPPRGRLDGVSDVRETTIHWTPLPEHFPVPSESIIQLPTGKPKAIPKIQHVFGDESANDKIDRLQKLEAIKTTFKASWEGYKKKAWMQDELSPVSGKSRNPFCGWAATLVDTLDTLWIMGLREEFEEAVNAVKNIDFTTANRQELPLFEVVIRYLGGLIAAFDLSSGTYRILLYKAVELAEILMGAFDTPNRMPVTFYPWMPTFASAPHRANPRVVLAELGSLSVEFTRLAQITRESKYYDAVARITNELESWQNNTKLPGLWPMNVDASGCKKPDVTYTSQMDHSLRNGPGYATSEPQKGSSFGMNVTPGTNHSNTVPRKALEKSKETSTIKLGESFDFPETKTPEAQVEIASLSKSKVGMVKRQLSDIAIEPSEQTAKATEMPDCEPQGLASPVGKTYEDFTIGGQADSVYEYLPKQYLLLGGVEEVYRRMYEKAVEATKKYLLFRPMLPDNNDILLSGKVKTSGQLDDPKDLMLTPEGTHLTCFAGGMFAIGAKIFNRESDLIFARKLTDGCVWAYEATTTGIMPEHYLVIPCESKEECSWNKTKYYEYLDPYRLDREQQRAYQQAIVLQNPKNIVNSRTEKEDANLRAKSDTAHYKDAQRVQSSEKTDGASTIAKQTAAHYEATQRAQLTKEADIASSAASYQITQATQPGEKAEASYTAVQKEATYYETAQRARQDQKENKAATAREDIPKESGAVSSKVSSFAKRQLGGIEDKVPLKPSAQTAGTSTNGNPQKPEAVEGKQTLEEETQANDTIMAKPIAEDDEIPVERGPNLFPILSHEEFIAARIKDERLPPGMTRVIGPKYILRPEAIESVFIMYRVTGDAYWREKGWTMFEAITKHTTVKHGASAIDDVTSETPQHSDEMESFWLAETLKYFFLLFSAPDEISLDDYVLNTEAHPFKRPK